MNRAARRLRAGLALVAVVLAAVACDDLDSDEVDLSAGPGGVTVTLDIDEPLLAGHPVLWRVVARNDSGQDVLLTHPSGQSAEVTLQAVGGDGTTWRWSDGHLFTQALRDVVLAPGTTSWELVTDHLDLPPGDYHATPSVTAASPLVGAPRTITVQSG